LKGRYWHFSLTLGETALGAHDKALGQDHAWTRHSARVTADALDALGRTEEAKELRERYGVASSDDAKRPSLGSCQLSPAARMG